MRAVHRPRLRRQYGSRNLGTTLFVKRDESLSTKFQPGNERRGVFHSTDTEINFETDQTMITNKSLNEVVENFGVVEISDDEESSHQKLIKHNNRNLHAISAKTALDSQDDEGESSCYDMLLCGRRVSLDCCEPMENSDLTFESFEESYSKSIEDFIQHIESPAQSAETTSPCGFSSHRRKERFSASSPNEIHQSTLKPPTRKRSNIELDVSQTSRGKEKGRDSAKTAARRRSRRKHKVRGNVVIDAGKKFDVSCPSLRKGNRLQAPIRQVSETSQLATFVNIKTPQRKLSNKSQQGMFINLQPPLQRQLSSTSQPISIGNSQPPKRQSSNRSMPNFW